MHPKDFLLQLAVCKGMGILSKWKIWQAASVDYEFKNITFLLQVAGLNVQRYQEFISNWDSNFLKSLTNFNRQISHLTLVDPDYPRLLKETYCPPLVLFYSGNIDLLKTPCLAVVGARQMTAYSKNCLDNLLPPVINAGYTVVSGLAKGVDGYSHKLTLQYTDNTIAVIGNGINRCYPKINQKLQEQIAKKGLLLTEYPLNAPSLPHHFPERNRIIAGISQACLITEARQKSGSLITANIALNENRNILAVPGPITSPLSQGCNNLIKEGAHPALTARDIITELKN